MTQAARHASRLRSEACSGQGFETKERIWGWGATAEKAPHVSCMRAAKSLYRQPQRSRRRWPANPPQLPADLTKKHTYQLTYTHSAPTSTGPPDTPEDD